MNAASHTVQDPHEAWLDRIEQQLREQDEALEQLMKELADTEPASIGIQEAVLEELREACTPRSRPAVAPVFATRC